MSGSIDYTRTLLRLLRDARQNPLVVAGAPWRLGMVPRLFWWAQVGVAGLLATGMAVSLLELFFEHAILGRLTWTLSRRISHLADEGIELIILGGILGSFVLVPLNLLVFASRWRDPDRLPELFLTRLSRRDMAFGSIYWGALGGLLIPGASFVAGALPIVLDLLPKVTGAIHSLWDPLFGLVLLVIAGEVIASALFVTVWYWFRMRGSTWLLVVFGPLLCGVGLTVVFFYALAGYFLIEGLVPWPYEQLALLPWFVFACTMATGHLFRAAGAFAPALFVRSLDDESHRHASVLAGMIGARRDRALRLTLAVQLRESVPFAWRKSVVSLLGFLALLCAPTMVSADLRNTASPFVGAVAALVLATFTCLVLEHRRRGGIALVRDALFYSLLRRVLPLHAAFFVLWCVTVIIDFPNEFLEDDYLLLMLPGSFLMVLLCNALLLVAHVGWLAWVLCPGRLRTVRLSLYVGLPMCAVVGAHILAQPIDDYVGFQSVLVATVPVTMLLLLLLATAVLRGIPWMQRLHDAVTRHVPIGGVGFIDGRRR
ncbi:MAG: hypothetical protein KF858_04265 [Candidatus Sumerlaeia bacterium]|nr:hypothetical protein [Candidatus Sumerlaeia bacterium]